MALNVRDIRRAAKLTQNQLADKIGCSRATIQRWESGQFRPFPCLEKKLQELNEQTLFMADVKEPEIKLLKTFYSAKDLTNAGLVEVSDIIDILYEYCNYETCEKYLRKWAQIGFYRIRGSVSNGAFEWDKLTHGYQRILKEWEEEG